MSSNYLKGKAGNAMSEYIPSRGIADNFTTWSAKPLIAMLDDDHGMVAGWGACKSCSCPGYTRGNKADICKCGHHFSQHK
jgi:hypothetical protein